MSSVRKNNWWRSLFSRTAPYSKKPSLHYKPSVLGLEERITPAFNTTLSFVDATVGMSIVTAAGTTTFTATASGAILNWGDIQGELVSGNNVVVNSGSTGTEAGNITDVSGIQMPGLAANRSLTFQSGTGANLVGDITILGMFMQSANGSVSISANRNITIGLLGGGTNVTPLPLANVTLTATTGSVMPGGVVGPTFATNLAISASTGIGSSGSPFLGQVSNLEAQTTTDGIFFSNTGNLAIGGVSGALSGVQVTGASGEIQITNSGTLTVSEPVLAPGDISLTTGAGNTFTLNTGPGTGIGTSGGSISISADRMTLSSGINSGSNRTTLRPASVGRVIDLGGADSATRLGLTDTEIDLITAGVLQIGSATAGAIDVTTAITPANTSTLALLSGAGISGAGSITVTNARFSASGAVNLSGGFTNLAGSTNAGITITNNANLTIGTVDTVSGLSAGGAINVTVAGALVVNNNITTTGASNITMTTTDVASAGQNITVNTGVIIQSGTGTLALRAGDDLIVNAGATLQTSGTGNINLSIDFPGGADSDGGILSTLGATISAPNGATYDGQNDADFFFINASVNTPISVTAGGGTDYLLVDAEGQSVNVSGNTITVAGRQPITISGINDLDIINGQLSFVGTSGNDTFVIDLGAGTVQLNGGAAVNVGMNPIQFNGQGGNDTVIVNGTGADESLLYRTRSGQPTVQEFNINGGDFNALTNVEGFVFNAGDGTDQMTVDYVNGNPVGSLGVDFNGELGSDLLVVTSPLADARTGNYLPSAVNPNDGQLNIGTGQIRFTSLAPVDVTGFATFTLLLPGGADLINVVGGTAFSMMAQPALVVTGTSNAIPFETLAIWNVTNFIIDTTTVDAADAITLGSTGPAAGHLITNLQLVTGNSADTVSVSGTINLGGSLSIDVGTGANVVTFTSATVNAPTGVIQTGAGSNVLAGGTTSLNTNSGNISLANAINGSAANAQSLAMTTTSGNINVPSIGDPTGLNTLTMTTTSGTFNLSGSTYRAGTQTYNGPVAVSAGTVLFDGTGPITFNNSLSGVGSDVTITTAGNTNLNGAVNVRSLLTNGGGSTLINTASVTSVNTQTYDDNVNLLVNTVVASTAGGNINFNSTLNGPGGANVNTTGISLFAGLVGNSSPLAFLTTNAGGATSINGGAVTTTGVQTYHDAVSLGANTTFSAGGNISFNSTLNGPGGANVNTTGVSLFAGLVGNSSPLAFLTTNAGGSTDINGGAVTTTGVQTYNDAVNLGANTTFSAGGNISFNSTLNGPGGANVNTSGISLFAGPVGNSTPLAFLLLDAPGITHINGGSIISSGNQTYNDPVTLGANTTLITNNSDITFASTLTSNPICNDLTIAIGAGNLLFSGAVTSLGNLLIQSANNVTINGTMSVSTLVQQASTGVTQFNAATTVNRACPFSDVFELDVTTNSIVLNAAVTVSNGILFFESRLNPTAGGVNQLAGSLVTGQLRLEGTGSFNLNQPGNDITGFLSANVDGSITLRDANDLEIKPTAEPQIPAGIITSNDDVLLTAGRNFTANNNAATLIDLGAGNFQAIPGTSVDSLVIFNTEINAATGTLGSSTLGMDNINSDRFRVRPSNNIVLTVYGNIPQAAVLPPNVADTILPLLDVPQTITLTTVAIPGTTSFNGNYKFSGGSKDINFFSIEGLEELRVEAVVYQTTFGNYQILLNLGQGINGEINPGATINVSTNLFVVAPRRINPAAPYSAPRVAIADFDGNTFPDLVIANGSNTSGVVSVIKGEALITISSNPLQPLTKSQLITQFYAFEPTYMGGLNVAMGNVTGDSKPEIIVGTETGRQAAVRIFSYDASSPTKLKDFDPGPAKQYYKPIPSATLMAAGLGTKGVRLAAGNITGGMFDDIVVGTGAGITNKVSIIKTNGTNFSIHRSFSPYSTTFKGGVHVAVGNFDGMDTSDLLIGPGAGPGLANPRLFVISGAMLKTALPLPLPPAGTGTDAWYLFNQDATFDIGKPGVQQLGWINNQGVSSVAFARTTSGQVSIVVASPRGLGTQLIRYTGANVMNEPTDYFTDMAFSTGLRTKFRDGASIAALL